MKQQIALCPNCNVSLQVTEEQLQLANGRVRCGACYALFSVDRSLLVPSVPQSGQPAGLERPPSPSASKDAMPHIYLADTRRKASSPWHLPLAAALCLAALGQYCYFNMATLSQQVSLRPYYLAVCELLPCQVPDFRDDTGLEVRQLIIRPHPEVKKALLVDLLLFNEAPYQQRFPQLQLDFTDLNRQLVASRRFKVREYLSGELRGLQHIPAGTEVQVSLEIVDPGDAAVSYQMTVIPAEPSTAGS